MNNPIVKLPNGDFKVESLSEFDQELKKLREEFPNLKGKKETKVIDLRKNNILKMVDEVASITRKDIEY